MNLRWSVTVSVLLQLTAIAYLTNLMTEHKTETEGQDSTDRSSRTQIGGDISSTVSDPRPLPPAASSPAQSSFPSRAAEFLVQNLPPQRSVTSSGEFDQRQAEKLVDLAYAWGQLEVASSAMANAYERLKGFGEQQLPTRSLRLRMRKFKQAARDVESLLPKKHARDTKEKGAEGEDAEEKGVGEKDADEKDAGEKDGEINVSAG